MGDHDVVMVDGQRYTLTRDLTTDSTIRVYAVADPAGHYLGHMRNAGGVWRISMADPFAYYPAADDAIRDLLAALREREDADNILTYQRSQPHVLIGYSDRDPGQKTRQSNAHLLGACDTEEEAHWMWDQAVRLAEKVNLAVYTKVAHWQPLKAVMSVRPADHPDALSVLDGSHVVTLAPGTGLKSRDAALRRWGRLHGYSGNVGGWISDPKGKRVAQGWRWMDRDEYIHPRSARVIWLDGGNGFRVITGGLLTPAQQSNRILDIALA